MPGDLSLHLKVCFVKPRGSVSFASAAEATATAAGQLDKGVAALQPSNCAVIAENLSHFLNDAGFESAVEEFDEPKASKKAAALPASPQAAVSSASPQAVASPALQQAAAASSATQQAAASPAAQQSVAQLTPTSKIFSDPAVVDPNTVYVLMIEHTRDANAWIKSQRPSALSSGLRLARPGLTPDNTVLVTSDRFFNEHRSRLSDWLVIEFAESGKRYELTPSGTTSELGLASQILNAISMKLVKMLATRGVLARELKKKRELIEEMSVAELLHELKVNGDERDASVAREVLIEACLRMMDEDRRSLTAASPLASPTRAATAPLSSIESLRLSSPSVGADSVHRRAISRAASSPA